MYFFQKIMERVKSPEVQLLCQISVSDDEYKELLKYIRSKISNLYMQAIPVPDLMLSITLVQIAIRRYDEGNYWDFFTSSAEFALESYSVRAADYVLKPVSKRNSF